MLTPDDLTLDTTDLITTDPITTDPITTDPITTDPITTTTPNATPDAYADADSYTPIYSMPPSPTAEPFIPASSVSATTDTPRDRAYTLHLQGYRSPAIAAHLHVPERTIRHWIHTTNQDINDLPALADALDALDALDSTDPDQQSTAAAPCSPPRRGEGLGERSTLTILHHQRTLAIERHRARSAAAWALHDQLRATLDPFLARLSERLLLHTQYPDDADHVSMSTLELAGGPLSPAFRAMYHMLPGIINGLTRTLALAERADLQIDRLLALPTTPARLQPPPTATTPASAPKPPIPAEQPVTPLPTSKDFRRAAEAERIAAEDAYIIPRLTEHQRNLIRAYCALPDPLPDGPIETWNIKIDPNAPLDRWREVLFPPKYHRGDPDYDPYYEPDNPDDERDPTPPSGATGKASGRRGTPPGNHSGNSGKKIGKHSGNHSGNPTSPQSEHISPDTNPRRRVSRHAVPSGAVLTAGRSTTGNPPGNPGKKIGKHSGKHSGNHLRHPTLQEKDAGG